MAEDFIRQVSNEAILMVLVVSGPPVLCSTVVGLAIALFQAVTQIQEQSLTFVPKIVVIFAVLAIFADVLGGTIAQFARVCFEGFATVVGR